MKNKAVIRYTPLKFILQFSSMHKEIQCVSLMESPTLGVLEHRHRDASSPRLAFTSSEKPSLTPPHWADGQVAPGIHVCPTTTGLHLTLACVTVSSFGSEPQHPATHITRARIITRTCNILVISICRTDE